MSWRDQLQDASFRGVPFHVDADAVPVGRRTQTHEYPKRDEAYVEDLGRRTRRYRMTAFVIGPDCFERRDALLKALETPGAGELVHPWLGHLNVTAGDCEMSHDRREGGMVRFELVFTEGEPAEPYPAARANTGRQTAAAADEAWSSGRERYGVAAAVLDGARVNIAAARGALVVVHEVIQQRFEPVAEALRDAGALVELVIRAPAELLGLFDDYFAVTPPYVGPYGVGLSGVVGAASAASGLSGVSVSAGRDTAAAVAVVTGLVQDAALYQAGRDAAALPVPAPVSPLVPPPLHQQIAQPIVRPEVAVTDDALAARNALRAALWSAAQGASHAHYAALTGLRLQADRHLAAVAAAGVRLERVTPLQAEPALVLSYRRFGDALRAEEIVTRNRIAHPGFVPPVPLQVASK